MILHKSARHFVRVINVDRTVISLAPITVTAPSGHNSSSNFIIHSV